MYFYFGSVGLFVFDLKGTPVWSKPLGPFKTRNGWGTAASPVVHRDRVYIVNDNDEQSFFVAYHKVTGAEIWRVPREEGSNWTTPFVWENDRRTEIVTAEGKLFLDSVLDMASRRIVGFSLGEHHNAELAYNALVMAVAVRGGKDAIAGVIMHTDQGSEYTAGSVRAACARLGITQSMGRPGSALDNAVIESWHSTVEFELRSLEQGSVPSMVIGPIRVAA